MGRTLAKRGPSLKLEGLELKSLQQKGRYVIAHADHGGFDLGLAAPPAIAVSLIRAVVPARAVVVADRTFRSRLGLITGEVQVVF